MHTTKRVFARAAVILALSLFALSTMTGTSSAHAQLEASDPPSGALMKTAPTRVTLTFGERVEVATNAIEVFDDHLQRVDTAKVARVPGDTNQIRVGLRANLRDGTYVVSWRVSSSDTHPVAGSLEFSVGAPSQVTGRIPGAGRRNEGAAVLLGLMRGVGYAGLVLAPGVLLVSALLWPAGLCSRRTRCSTSAQSCSRQASWAHCCSRGSGPVGSR
jgi:copper transport protein